jgi:hypothetical protein
MCATDRDGLTRSEDKVHLFSTSTLEGTELLPLRSRFFISGVRMNTRLGESEVRLDAEMKINPCLARIQLPIVQPKPVT